MINRFKRFLEREFRAIAPTKAAMEYREEMLTRLLDKAQELRIKGMTDEDIVYDLCIDSLGDFRAKLVEWDKKRLATEATVKKLSMTTVAAICVALFMVIGYLVLSFVTGEWGKTWLVLVGAIFVGVMVVNGIILGKKLAKKKTLPAMINLAIIIVLAFVLAFLILVILVPTVANSWLLFLAMVVAILGGNMVVSLLCDSKLKLLHTIAFVQVLSVMVYVVLGITQTLPWSPYWLIPVGGVFVNICIVAGKIFAKTHKKQLEAEQANEDKNRREDEAYYTSWSDEK